MTSIRTSLAENPISHGACTVADSHFLIPHTTGSFQPADRYVEVRINLLGQFECELGGVTRELKARKTRALFAWLAMHQGKPQPRTKLANLLWADSGSQQARQSLRQAVADLRRLLGEHDVLEADTERLSIKAGAVTTDIDEFVTLANASDEVDLVRASTLYRGELLESEDPRSEPFEEWLGAERLRLAELHQVVLRKLVDSYRHTDLEEAIRYGQKIVSLDPLQGQMHRRLMELYRDAGRPEDAIRQFRTYKNVLNDQLGIEPEAETEALLEEIVSARHGPETKTPATESSQSAPSGSNELRQVVALAVHVRNLGDLALSMDTEDYINRVQSLEDYVRTTCETAGGVIVQANSEIHIALFGLPAVTGNELRRSTEAALAIRDSSDDDLALSLAVATGQVVVNVHGDLQQAQGSVIAQVGQLARSAGAGELIAPVDVVDGLAHLVEFEPRLENPVADVVCIQRMSEERKLTPFSGRKLQMQQMGLALQACQDTGLGQTILIRGEAGLGKSRVVLELIDEARSRGYAAARANLSDTTNNNISNLTRLVTRILEFDESVTPEEVNDDDLVRLGLGRGQRSALIDLLDLEMPHELRDFWDAMSDERRQETRRAGLEAIVAHACRDNPVLTVIEDLQWAESSILARIGVLASIVADYPMLLVLTSRIDETIDQNAWRGPSQRAPFTTLDLSPMREAEAMELGRHMHDDDDLIRRCFQRSGGNPLFLEQLLRSSEMSRHGIPDSIQSLVEATVYQLPSQDLDAIQAASVLGFEFTSEALGFVLEQPDYSPDALLKHRLIFQSGDKYEFSHALIRESTYQTMLRSRRSALHLRAAEYYKQTNRAMFVEHLLAAESENAPTELLAIAREEQQLHRHDRARILVRKGLIASTDEKTRRAFKQLEDNLLTSDPGWEDLAKS